MSKLTDCPYCGGDNLSAEARIKELEEALQFIANCCPEWTARTTAENALKGKV